MSEFDDIFTGPKKETEEVSVPAFDKEEWVQQKKAEREKAYETIDQMAELMVTDGEHVKNYLDLQSRFPRYSVGNILLVSAQKPDATRIGDFKSWKEAGAFIKQGETGIIILEPGNEYTKADGSIGVAYNAKRVFDISQTTAKAVPEPEIHRDDRLLIKALIYNAPCEVRIDDNVHFPEGVAARYDSGARTIYVARGQEGAMLFCEIARELAHAHMDSAGKEAYSRENCEFTATCVSYMLCKRNNVDVSSFSFVDLPESFKALDSKGVRTELGKIRDVANSITVDMDRLAEKQKDAKARDDAR